jgi:sigma-B regulation protein RsbU (phosphoserine phosphatase)
MTLRPGDALFLYTDGITEAENADQTQFSMSRLLAALGPVVAAPCPDVVAATIAGVRAHAGDTPPSDDLTTLVVRYRGSR